MTLRTARVSKGIKQADLATMADINVATLSFIENGKTTPQEVTRQKLEQALGCSIDWRHTFEEAILRNPTPSAS
ncbi:helix-turn-helix domain-containing protein [Gracilimonas sp. Q87]|uniref:helix-turn-helix domain-containing protein n=1 Tax=Gracilimonas sp. Q87 TaxID=3384766 RepID=UPI003984369A